MNRRRVAAVAGVVLLAGIVTGVALHRTGDDRPAEALRVDWVDSEGHPGCAYDPETRSVEATLIITGTAPASGEVTLTVTAYADENTSRPVGSSSRTVPVTDDLPTTVVVTVPVDRAPHLDDDGIAACSRTVQD